MRSLIEEVRGKGRFFSLLFWLFFFLCVLSVLTLLVFSVIRLLIPLFIVFLVLAALVLYEIRNGSLFALSLMVVILNITLWFCLGFISFLPSIIPDFGLVGSLLLLVPYSIFSGFFIHQLLVRAGDERRSVLGTIVLSVIIAFVSSVSDFMLVVLSKVRYELSWFHVDGRAVLEVLGLRLTPFIAFLVVLVFFNSSSVWAYWHKGEDRRLLWWFFLPIVIFFVFAFVFKSLSPGILVG